MNSAISRLRNAESVTEALFGKRLFLGKRLRIAGLRLRDRFAPWVPEPGKLRWLFVATLPNSGSTALAQLLLSASAASFLERTGEGQWLVPQLRDPNVRWNPRARVSYSAIRACWMDAIRRRAGDACLVIEKSPPNLVRMREILATFDDMPVSLIRLWRDPYAVCSSWASRYGPQRIARDWGEPTADMAADSDEFFRALGDLCGRRAAMLAQLSDLSVVDVSYEVLTTDPGETIRQLQQAEPLLADMRSDASLAVKDYAPQPLQNMNAGQIARLSPSQISAITAGLLPFADQIATMGYELRR